LILLTQKSFRAQRHGRQENARRVILLFRVKDYSLALIKEILFAESKEKKVIDFADAKKFSRTKTRKTRRCTKR